jgi:hypothetical protein
MIDMPIPMYAPHLLPWVGSLSFICSSTLLKGRATTPFLPLSYFLSTEYINLHDFLAISPRCTWDIPGVIPGVAHFEYLRELCQIPGVPMGTIPWGTLGKSKYLGYIFITSASNWTKNSRMMANLAIWGGGGTQGIRYQNLKTPSGKNTTG